MSVVFYDQFSRFINFYNKFKIIKFKKKYISNKIKISVYNRIEINYD